MLPSNEQITVLSPEDIQEIDRFHTAWCEENGVDKADRKAIEVASALIDWYTSDSNYRRRAIVESPPPLPKSEAIEKLLRQMT